MSSKAKEETEYRNPWGAEEALGAIVARGLRVSQTAYGATTADRKADRVGRRGRDAVSYTMVAWDGKEKEAEEGKRDERDEVGGQSFPCLSTRGGKCEEAEGKGNLHAEGSACDTTRTETTPWTKSWIGYNRRNERKGGRDAGLG